MSRFFLAALLIASPAFGQPPSQPAPLAPGQTSDPFPAPIAVSDGVRVNFREFASMPEVAGVAARVMNLITSRARGACSSTTCAARSTASATAAAT